MVKASGISLLKATSALNPVQWVPTIWSGFIALISATVLAISSGLALLYPAYCCAGTADEWWSTINQRPSRCR